jgi:formylglycine-generating enzyme
MWRLFSALVMASAACLASTAHAQPSAAGAIVKDCARDCPQLVIVPAGASLLGSTEAETTREGVVGEKWIGRDKPQYTVSIAKPFAIGRYEITVGQYRAFAKATRRADGPNCWIYNPSDNYKFEETLGVTWRSFAMLDHKLREDEPISCVSWDDATAYVQWLSAKTGKKYRLPSEGEWEYAARAGSKTSRFWGDDRESACLYSNIGDMSAAKRFRWRNDPQYHFMCTDGYPMYAPVGTFKPNAFGLYDTQGNVYEWVQDCFAETNDGAPTDGSARTGPDCSQRALRGGGFGYYPHYERTSFRIGVKPDYYSFLLGFRVVRDLE